MSRWLAAAALALGANLLLLLFMGRLVAGGPGQVSRTPVPTLSVDLVQVEREPPPPPPREPPPPEPERRPPPPPPTRPVTTAPPRVAALTPDLPNLKLPLRLGAGPFIGAYVPPPLPVGPPALETGVTPLVRIPPRYPRRARLARIEGHVAVELTVQEDGSVSDPRVVDSQPPGTFDAAVLRVVDRWRFAPRLVDGRPVARRVLQTVHFNLAEN